MSLSSRAHATAWMRSISMAPSREHLRTQQEYRSRERDYWARMRGRSAPAYEPRQCHSNCAPPARLEWEAVNHAVLVVGYGVERAAGENVSYWITQNAWGKAWGENGFARIATGEASLESLGVAVQPMV